MGSRAPILAPGRSATRTMMLWCPDWPITAILRDLAIPENAPLALIDKGEVFACSPAARLDGVRRGLRVREAQARCPALTVKHYDPDLDERVFEPVVTAIEQIMPGVQLVRPGLCAIQTQGPSRYYGGESLAAAALIATLTALGLTAARIGIADSPFAAEHAARATEVLVGVEQDPIWVVPAGGSAQFLGSFPLEVLEEPRLTVLLKRLGIRTLGEFAALDATDVRNRFGIEGALAHRKACGLDHRSVVARTPPPELDVAVDFEPALVRIDQLAFAFRTAADRFVERLRETGLVCTVLRVVLHSESGEVSDRLWRHPRWFDADDVLDRVRWQLQGGGLIEHGLHSGITRVHTIPETVEDLGDHADGLWGTGPDESIHHGLARVQSMLGHGAVLTASIAGGRMLKDRRVFIPWGDSPAGNPLTAMEKSQPWPGRIPGPAPATVFDEPQQVQVLDTQGGSVDVDSRGMLITVPSEFSPPGATVRMTVHHWAGPWPVTERWWDSSGRTLNRFQLVDATGAAWLLLLEDHQWWAEASYD
ncbi:DNA polymerase Y family protein [Arthrobacter sp. 260]|nr:DNA polymerase Y family protein [Arthrobacter sp. 260]